MGGAKGEVVQRLNTCLKRLSAGPPLSDAAWEHLASLPRLKCLLVSNTPSTKTLRSAPHGITFLALEQARITVDDPCQHWSILFSLLRSSLLQQVTVVANRGSPRVDFSSVDTPSQVTNAILKAGLQRGVGTLTFTRFDPSHLTFISHLGPFSSLKALSCDTQCRGPGGCVSPLTDSDIEQLASGLPQLATLHLGHACKHSQHSTTIRSMISLSTHCLSLANLGLPCGFTNISEDTKTGSGESDPRLEIWSPCALWLLTLQWITMPPPEDVEAAGIVASALHHLFPRLRLGGREASWETILDVLKNLRREELAHTM
jgi:hypothetical protein